MSDAPLRQLFARFVFSADTGFLKKTNALVSGVKANLGATLRASDGLGGSLRRAVGGAVSAVAAQARQARGAFATVQQDGKRIEATFGTLGPTIAAALGGTALLRFGKDLIDSADSADELSTALGMSVEQIQNLQMFAKIGSVDAGTLTGGLRAMAKAVGEFKSTGKGKGAKVFAELGISDAIKQSDSLQDSFFLLGNKMSEMSDDEKKLAAFQKIFGGAGIGLVTAFADGPEKIAEIRKRIAEIGPMFDANFAASASEFNDEMDFAKYSAMGLAATFIRILMPALRTGAHFLAVISGNVQKFAKETKILQAILAMLATRWIGGILLAKLSFLASGFYGASQGMMILGRAGLAAMRSFLWLTFLALLFEDIIVLMNGGKSAIGRLIDGMMGVGTAKQLVQDLKDKWAEIGPAFTEGGKVAIKALADITVGIISGIGWLTSSGAAADKWATAFEGAMDRLWKLFGGENDPVAEWIFWISDSLENLLAKFRAVGGFWEGVKGMFGGGDKPGGWAAGMSKEDAWKAFADGQAGGQSRSLRANFATGLPGAGKSITINDERKTTLQFAGAVDAKAVGAEVSKVQKSDRSKTAAAAGVAP